MDRSLVAEFPIFSVQSDLQILPTWTPLLSSDTRYLGNDIFVQEMKLDLAGYVQSDLTLGFRRSFEQESQASSMAWDSPGYSPQTDGLVQQTIISSVPFTDQQLIWTIVNSPGFIQPGGTGGVLGGNFNRTHIIHGRFEAMYANSIFGSSAFNNKGSAIITSIVDNYYSSLEPTAADCLYCYRVLGLPTPGTDLGGLTVVTLPSKRVILDAFTVEEPDLEYMMRLKRSYELANQV